MRSAACHRLHIDVDVLIIHETLSPCGSYDIVRLKASSKS
jgi:hypothetical protein